MIIMRFPEGRAKAVTLSYDDGVVQDKRLIEIMSKHGIKGTFNINTGWFPENDVQDRGHMSAKQVAELYTGTGNEVAVHTYSHSHLEDLPPELVCEEVLTDRRIIEEIFGTVARGMAYPFGSYNDTVVDCLKACGIAYARTVKQTEDFKIPEDWLRLNPTCYHKNPKLFEIAERFISFQINESRVSKLFYLWGHSYEFDDDNNWDVIERFCEMMGGRDDFWYATNIEIYDYVQAYKKLRFNINKTIVENPTATDVWFEKEGKMLKIGAGETVSL